MWRSRFRHRRWMASACMAVACSSSIRRGHYPSCWQTPCRIGPSYWARMMRPSSAWTAGFLNMKTPKRIQPLVEEGLVDEVIRQLMSGKEATVYVVRCGNEIRCAKVYKEAENRSFRQAVSYQEGRKVKNSRQARAMEKGSR